jgi:hypothetical protein
MTNKRLQELVKKIRVAGNKDTFNQNSNKNPFFSGDDLAMKVRMKTQKSHDSDYKDGYETFGKDKDEDDFHLGYNDRSYRRNEFNDEDDIDDIDADAGWAFMRDLDDEFDDDEFDADDDDYINDVSDIMNAGDDDAGGESEEGDDEFDGDEESDDSDKNYAGNIRAIKGAYLVRKVEEPDETYTEVWMYSVGKRYADEANIRKNILAGTDIDPTKNFSEDGTQESVITTIGNVQYLAITGLPN